MGKHRYRKIFDTKEAKKIGNKLRIDWDKIDINQFEVGMNVELEHGRIFGFTNITDDDPVITGKIALAHLMEFPDYYTRLNRYELYMKRGDVFTLEDAKKIGNKLKIDWNKFDLEQFRIGLNVELEHGKENALTDITHDDPILTGKIAFAHMIQFPFYYVKLTKMEKEAENYFGKKEEK